MATSKQVLEIRYAEMFTHIIGLTEKPHTSIERGARAETLENRPADRKCGSRKIVEGKTNNRSKGSEGDIPPKGRA